MDDFKVFAFATGSGVVNIDRGNGTNIKQLCMSDRSWATTCSSRNHTVAVSNESTFSTTIFSNHCAELQSMALDRRIVSCAVSADSHNLALGADDGESELKNAQLHCVKLLLGILLGFAEERGQFQQQWWAEAHQGQVDSLSFDDSGLRLASCGADEGLRVWDSNGTWIFSDWFLL